MKFRRTKKPSTTLDISPLLDIVLQLLIFFMLSSTFMAPRIEVALPEAQTNDGPGDGRAVMVSAGADGRLFVNQVEVLADGLLDQLRNALAEAPEKAVIFRGDESVPYKTVVQVIDAARRAGAKSLDIAHNTPPTGE